MRNRQRALPIKLFLMMAALLLNVSNTQAAPSSTTTYYHTDALGSIVAASDEAGGIIWRKTYDPYGNEVISTESGEEYEGQAYTGQPYDKETGLIYLGQRYYDPQLRRFISMDPVGFTPANPTSFNPYAYANNNPYKYVDPDGTFAFIPYLIGLGLAAADVALQSYFAPEVDQESGAVQSIDILPGPASSAYYGSKVGLTASKSIFATKGLAGNPLFKSALGQFKNSQFSNAGRAVTKHAEYFGFKNTEALRKIYNTEAKINQLAANTLKNIMRSGKTTTGAGGRYPNGWKTITGADGRAASWHADGRFIGFRGVQ